ncbi:MAG TPA: hypothetical protein VHD56_07270 [Tepidisphaeraceae bacterium]|nr:hypothetical protein [Tepidisphaeraceae bacterium]
MARKEAFQRLGNIKDELEASRFAIECAQREIKSGKDTLKATSGVLPSHLRNCAANLEVTYSLRMFAGFEATLRKYLSAVRPSPRPRQTRMEHLMNRIATICSVPYDVLNQAHSVRKYRNEVIHQRELAGRLTFHDCKSHLGKFLSFLPLQW